MISNRSLQGLPSLEAIKIEKAQRRTAAALRESASQDRRVAERRLRLAAARLAFHTIETTGRRQ
jgi:hypothetical protein